MIWLYSTLFDQIQQGWFCHLQHPKSKPINAKYLLMNKFVKKHHHVDFMMSLDCFGCLFKAMFVLLYITIGGISFKRNFSKHHKQIPKLMQMCQLDSWVPMSTSMGSVYHLHGLPPQTTTVWNHKVTLLKRNICSKPWFLWFQMNFQVCTHWPRNPCRMTWVKHPNGESHAAVAGVDCNNNAPQWVGMLSFDPFGSRSGHRAARFEIPKFQFPNSKKIVQKWISRTFPDCFQPLSNRWCFLLKQKLWHST